LSNNLIIVESPAKVKTIKKFLGSNYDVTASAGHVRDLPKSKMGVDIANDFEPEYITIRGKGKVVADLKKKAKAADKVFLATDPDREGEAISWHLMSTLGLSPSVTRRITFNEITKTAVQAAIKNPREIDMKLVDAQQARRVLDRIVGYSISPLLWRKVKKGLSAGRVQSATLAMICEREEEIAAFIPEEYWSLDALLTADDAKKAIAFKLAEKEQPSSQEEMDKLLASLEGQPWKVADIKTTPKSRKAPLPFTTSTLQQEAAKYLSFAPQKTMRIAQQLYEGVALGAAGTTALITYLRTDSTRVAAEAHMAAKEFIGNNYGAEYVAAFVADGKAKDGVQDAHEAIRPTDVNRKPEDVKAFLERDQLRLYTLIWKRFVASRMAPQETETVTVRATCAEHSFSASSTKVTFKGYKLIYDIGDETETANSALEKISMESKLELVEFKPEQHFTQPPAHYTEASLVRAMEECGIGRPSTYAPTITLLGSRGYIIKEKKSIFVTELGEAVNKIMKDHFKDIVDTGFTADMEGRLDKVAEGEDWKALLRGFYPQFESELKAADEKIGHVKIADPVTDVICEKCGRNMVIKLGKYGKFLACPGFPECSNIKPYIEKAGVACPKCGADIIIKKTKKGRRFYGCEKYPECDYVSWTKPKKTK